MKLPRHSAALCGLGLVACLTGHTLVGSVPAVGTNQWVAGPALFEARAGATATSLGDGNVLVVGGRGASGPLASVELLTSSGTAVPSAPLPFVRADHAAALVGDGQVLVAGGTTVVTTGEGTAEVVTGSAAVFDAAAAAWYPVGALSHPRAGATAVALPEGLVAIVGGHDASGPVLEIEIYDPTAGAFVPGGAISAPRAGAAVTSTRSGLLVVVGGAVDGVAQSTADIIDPIGGAVATVSLTSARTGASATTTVDDQVLIAGGSDGSATLATTEVLDPVTGNSASGVTLGAARSGHRAYLLPHNGSVLLVGGSNEGGLVADSELVIPWVGAAQALGPVADPRGQTAGAAGPDSGVFVVTGGSSAAGAVSPSSDYFGFATLRTDKDDYAPGEFVTISGGGWQPGETVNLTLREVGTGAPDTPLNAVADEQGNILNDFWAPNESHAGVRFYLTATGAGATAQMTFTDSVTSVDITSPTGAAPVTAVVGGTVTVQFNYQTSAGPTQATARMCQANNCNAVNTVAINTKPLTPGTGSDSVVLTIPTGASGAYRVQVTVQNPTPGGNPSRADGENDAILVATDTTPPVVSPSIAGTPGSNGWYTSDVTVSWSVTDPDSSVTSPACGPTTITSDTAGTDVTCVATSAGGTTSSTVTIKRDATAPSATIGLAGTLGSNGWYTSDVTATTTGADPTSGPVTCTGPQVLTAETVGTDVNGECTNQAGLSAPAAPVSVKIDKTAPTVQLVVTAGTEGANGWYTSDVTVDTDGTDAISGIVSCTVDQFQTTETAGQFFNGQCTNGAGLVGNAAPLTVKLDKTGPVNVVIGLAGTLGDNGWYTSDVTATTSGDELVSGPATCTPPQSLSAETAGAPVNGECTNEAGLSTSASEVTVKIDKTAPTVQLVVTGTEGANGWYTSDVTVDTQGTDSVSGVADCTADQSQTAETTGQLFSGTCTNNAGLTSDPASLTVKVDKTGPTAALAVILGDLGSNGWYVSAVTVATSGADSISAPVTCTPSQPFVSDTTGTTVNGQCTNDAGLQTSATALVIKIDQTKPTLSPSVNPNPALLNGPATATPNAADATSGLASASCDSPDTATVGSKTLSCSATDNAGNSNSVTASYSVQFASGGLCLGSPGHQILQPINAVAPFSSFKQKSTVPAKFRVCDANGVSVGSDVVSAFFIVQVVSGASTLIEDLPVASTTPDTTFRWSPTDQQWIYNINTKGLSANKTYYFEIRLTDGSVIPFNFGLK